jgi:hypothetical protein
LTCSRSLNLIASLTDYCSCFHSQSRHTPIGLDRTTDVLLLRLMEGQSYSTKSAGTGRFIVGARTFGGSRTKGRERREAQLQSKAPALNYCMNSDKLAKPHNTVRHKLDRRSWRGCTNNNKQRANSFVTSERAETSSKRIILYWNFHASVYEYKIFLA